ncbi:MAG TPA: type IV toxin-antitoxin system AbiEi family antitoxin domain-containing protein, partial [Solirubrobacterales bacterium]
MAELAERQHGVVSGRQLAKLGYSDDTVWREATSGRLHRLHRDVYAVGHGAVSRQGQALAAVLTAGDGTLLSHRSAAWLWGLTARWQQPVEVTAASSRRNRPGIRLHSVRALTPDDRSSVEGIPVTAIPRTLLDFAAV